MKYAMFTDTGDMAVHAIVTTAIEKFWSYNNLEKALMILSKIDGFEEATDTAVRECAFVALRDALNVN